jgi:poly(3-hydroxybutyrate) depolymerase
MSPAKPTCYSIRHYHSGYLQSLKIAVQLTAIVTLLFAAGAFSNSTADNQASLTDKLNCQLFGAARGLDTALTIRSNEINRSYVLHLPQDYNCASRHPLVIGLHGYTGSGSGFQHDTAGMFASINQNNFIGVFPDGIESAPGSGTTAFNDLGSRFDNGPQGPTCAPNSHPYDDFENCPEAELARQCHWGTSCADDLSFLRDLINHLQAHYSIDAKRIVLMGFSQGAQAAAGLACGLQDKLAAVIPVHGFPTRGYACGPESKVSLFQIVGRLDQIVNGLGQASADGMIYDSAATTASVWAEAQHCANGKTPYPTVSDGYLGWQCTEHASCASAAAIVTCAWQGDHIWAKQGSRNIGLEAIWEFIGKQSK